MFFTRDTIKVTNQPSHIAIPAGVMFLSSEGAGEGLNHE